MQVVSQYDVSTPVNIGSAVQVALSPANITLSTTVPANSSIVSQVITTNGYKVFGIGITSSQDGTLSVQRYLDAAGTIQQDGGVPFEIDLVAGQAATLNENDWKPFQSIKITVSNATASIATISLFQLLLQSY